MESIRIVKYEIRNIHGNRIWIPCSEIILSGLKINTYWGNWVTGFSAQLGRQRSWIHHDEIGGFSDENNGFRK